MNRENKRKTFEKGYYKTHACRDTFTCKVCGRLCTPENAGSDHRNHVPNCLSSLHVDIERATAKRLRRHHGAVAVWCEEAASGRSSTAASAGWSAQFGIDGGRRQPDEARQHRHAAAQRAAVPPQAHRR